MSLINNDYDTLLFFFSFFLVQIIKQIKSDKMTNKERYDLWIGSELGLLKGSIVSPSFEFGFQQQHAFDLEIEEITKIFYFIRGGAEEREFCELWGYQIT